jgi:penicillin-binding protein 1A
VSDDTKQPPTPAPPQTAGHRRRLPWKTVLKWGGPVLVAVLVGAVAGVAVASAIHMPRVESLANFTPGLITRMLDRDGDPFASFSIERRVLLEESELPELLTQALLASEDRNFMQHGGVDPLAILRAQVANLRAGDIEEGASTLTMQLARELFLTREKRWRRKIEEAMLAVELEKNLSKEQILTLYMNQVNFGNGNYGAAAAAEDYFGKKVDELTVTEAATLVGVLPAPSRYNPYRNPEMAVERRNSVLRKMADAGYITRGEADAARRQPLQLVRATDRRRLGSYFAEDVRKLLDDTYGTAAVVKGGLTVQTTMDPQIQRDAEEALRRGLVRLDHRRGWRGPVEHVDLPAPELADHELADWQGIDPIPGPWYQGLVLSSEGDEARVKIEDAVFTLDREGMAWTRKGRPGDILEAGDVAWFRLEGPESPETDVEADEDVPLSGGDDPSALDPSRLTLHLEQEPEMESAVVVIESATGAVRAMVGGFSFERSKFNRASQAKRQVGSAFKPFVYGAALEAGYTPADTLFDAPTGFPGGDGRLSYRPRNYTRSFRGILTLRRALQQSVNVPAVKLIDMVGVQRVIALARRFGIRSELPPYPSLALGAAEITPLELAGAYAALANQGTWVEPYLIESAVTADGDLLEEHVPVTQSAMDPRTAYVLIHMMEGVVDRGTAVRLKSLPIDIAGKTGTTNDYTDAWFAGITPRYTILTWVGFDAKRKLGRGMTGSEAALPIWKDLAEAGLEHGWLEEGSEFPVPPGVTFKTIEYTTGLLPGPGAGQFIEEAFVEGTEPAQEFGPRWAGIMSLPWYQQRPFYIPKENERMPTGDTWSTDDEALTGMFAEEAAD